MKRPGSEILGTWDDYGVAGRRTHGRDRRRDDRWAKR